ncbi:MAG TPA: dTDP-4-dehydrorhamnose 3,5-epimerase family protein [Candidatus Elarobacter sp.]
MTRVVGEPALAAKHSAVNEDGALRDVPIDGVRFRPARPVPHEDGYLTEVARAGWDLLQSPIVQVHVTTTFAGRIRAWGIHHSVTDRLFVVAGLVKIVVFDGRQASPTFGRINEFVVGERNPGLLLIPPDLYHGWKNVGTVEAVIINMPDAPYDYDAPDGRHLSWESEAARDVIPYGW